MDYVEFKWKNSTRQSDRLPAALKSGYIDIDERTFEDLVSQMAEYARSVKFYEEGNLKNYVSDWKNFFKDIYQYEPGEDGKSGLLIDKLERLQAEGSIKPHMALMLSFLKMYQLQQQNLNNITERHLDYYYKEMLGFTPKQGSTGKVTVFPMINKKYDQVIIPKGTLFDAGKDANGDSVYYASVNELTVTRAKITEAKYIDSEGRVCSLSYGDVEVVTNSKPSAIGDDKYGFAITGPHLEQLDVEWVVSGLRLTLENCFIDYTTKDGWENMNIWKAPTGSAITFMSNIKQPISKYEPAIHGEGFETEYPIIRFISRVANHDIKAEDIKQACIYVKNSENLIIENAYGKVENKKGAQPFGGTGKSSDFFIITPPKGAFLRNIYDKFQPNKTKNWDITYRTTTGMDNSGAYSIGTKSISCTYKLINDELDQQKKTINLAVKLAKYAREGSSIKDIEDYITTGSECLIPSVPIFDDKCSIDYAFNLTDGFNVIPFSPFGISPAMSIEKSIGSINNNRNNPVKGNEALYFAVEGIKGDSVLSVYFDVDDTNLVKPAKVFPKWSYRTGDTWSNITESDILTDSTNGLDHSGIITFYLNLPNTPEDVVWLRAENMSSEEKDTAYRYLSAVKKIRANALELEYYSDSKSSAPTGVSLPAGTIGKMAKNIVGIKSVEQPFDGEKGVASETEEKFRCRVSERLRHKGKAINKWDYERIVLERFPQIAEAKCMPSWGTLSIDGKECRDYKPGSVLLLVAPDKECKLVGDKLRPEVGKKMLSEIQTYMNEFKPPFVDLEVKTLGFEPVKVSCTIKLRSGYYNINYYKSKTDEELKKLIAPWSDNSVNVTMTNDLTLGDILNRLECLEWVDAVTDLSVEVIQNNLSSQEIHKWSMDDGKMAEAITPYDKTNVITSDSNHEINIV
ncbi:MAG: baseplate J/gp47 family protein [Paludibacteraceae bacterium]|nr:baseplate J/gp47 family protein [Paludibacteraceae bacterium]